MSTHFRLLPTPEGLTLAGVMIAKRGLNKALDIDGREEEIHALLSVACGKALPLSGMGYLKHASHWFAKVSDADLKYTVYPCFPCPHQPKTNPGEQFPAIAMLETVLALSGVNCKSDPKARLLKAQEMMRKGVLPSALFKALAKDTGDDDGDDESDDGSDDSGRDDNTDSPDSSDFDAEHPRWPAGSPGGIGGEFKPMDEDADNDADDGTIIIASPHEQRFGLPDEFWQWYHRQVKQPGDSDITRPEVLPIYQEWLRLGKPGSEQG